MYWVITKCQTGTVIAQTISAAPYAAEIVLSEYAEANRAALSQWLNNDPNAFDWTHSIKHIVVNLEGKSQEVQVRVGVQSRQSCCAL